MPFKVIQDIDKCIGCGACVEACPTNWKMNGDKAHPIKTSLEEVDCNNDAADSCPEQCIKIEEA